MSNKEPDFYLTSSESESLKPLRKCYIIKRMPADGRDDYLLIQISPPIDSRDFGIGDEPICEVIVAAHLAGVTLFPISEWPVSVHVLRVLVDHPEEHIALRDGELELIAWAELYENEATAKTSGA